MSDEFEYPQDWARHNANVVRMVREFAVDAHCRALAIEDILVNAGLTDRVRLAALFKAKHAAVRPGEDAAATVDEAPQPPEQADAPTSRDDYARRFLDHLFARSLPGGNSDEHALVYWAHVKEAVNNPELFPAPVVQGIDPEALRALPRRLVISGAVSLCNSEHGDIVFWRDIQTLIDLLPAEPPASVPECKSHRWVSYLTCYADRSGVFRRRICPVCKKDEAAPPNSDQAKPGVICWPLDVATPNEPGKPEPEPSAEAECEHDWQVTYKSLRWHPEHPWHRLTCVKCLASRRVSDVPAEPVRQDGQGDWNVAPLLPPDLRAELEQLIHSRAFGGYGAITDWLAERGYTTSVPELIEHHAALLRKAAAATVGATAAQMIAEACEPRKTAADPGPPQNDTITSWSNWSSDGPRTVMGSEYMPPDDAPQQPDEPVAARHCPNCASEDLQERGFFPFSGQRVLLFSCGACGVNSWHFG